MASTSLITDMTTVSTNGPSAATTADAIAAAGPINDYKGNVQGIIIALNDIKQRLAVVIASTDAGDPNLTTLNNVNASLS